MAYYKFEKDCGLVDAEDAYTKVKKKSKKSGNPCPLILDVRDQKNKKEYPLNEEAGFIVSFLVQGLDTALVSQAFASQYNVTASQANTEVQNVVTALQNANLLRSVPYQQKKNSGAQVGQAQSFEIIELNFTVDGWGDSHFGGPF